MAHGLGPTACQTMTSRDLLHRAVTYAAVFSIKSGILSIPTAKPNQSLDEPIFGVDPDTFATVPN